MLTLLTDSFARLACGSFLAMRLAGLSLVAQETPGLPVAPDVPSTNLLIKSVGPGQFEIGLVRLDKRERTVSFPAVMHMNEATIEYLVVTSTGKTHESLLRTDAQPHHLHVAMLLLGAIGAGTNSFPEGPRQLLPGDTVTIEVTWTIGRRQMRRRAEELVYNRRTKSAMSRGDWVYNGSRLLDGGFAAQRDGSIVSLITDPDALVNNPRPDRGNDDNWTVNKTGLPPLNSPVRVTLRLAATPVVK